MHDMAIEAEPTIVQWYPVHQRKYRKPRIRKREVSIAGKDSEMFCPTCGADIPESRYCQNCGSLLAAENGNSDEQLHSDAVNSQNDETASFQTAQAIEGDVRTVHDAPIDPESTSNASGPSFAHDSQPGIYQWNDVATGQTDNLSGSHAPNTAFVLAIVGLVLSILGFSLITLAPALVCSIVALVLNRKYAKQGIANPHRTSTTVMGVIGIVLSVLLSIAIVLVGALAYKATLQYGESGDLSELVEELEHIDAHPSSGKSAGSTASTQTEGTDSQSAVAPEKQGNPNQTTSNAASSSSFDSRAFDASGNLTLYALCELAGSDLQNALEAQGYIWIENAHTWMRPDGALLEIQGKDGALSKDAIAGLDKGAGDTPAVFIAASKGYDNPQAALDGLAANSTLKNAYTGTDEDIAFAIAHSPEKKDYLVTITNTAESQQTILLFNEEAVKQGLFTDITGVKAGKTIDAIWKVITAE